MYVYNVVKRGIMDIKILLGRRIKELRKAKNITQESMAEIIGIDTVSVSNIERGKYYPTAENLNKIMNILKVEPHELFSIEHNASENDLLDEMINKLKNNKKLTKIMYKIFQALKTEY